MVKSGGMPNTEDRYRIDKFGDLFSDKKNGISKDFNYSRPLEKWVSQWLVSDFV